MAILESHVDFSKTYYMDYVDQKVKSKPIVRYKEIGDTNSFFNHIVSLERPSPLRKELLQNLRSMKSKLQHVWHWKEMDDGQELTVQLYDSLMKEAGLAAEKADESLAGVKGQLAAGSQRAKAK